MAYNTSILKNVTSVEQPISRINEMSGGLWGIGVLAVVVVMVFVNVIRSERYGISDAFLASGFTGTIVGGFMWLGSFLPWEIAVIPFGLAVIGFIAKYYGA